MFGIVLIILGLQNDLKSIDPSCKMEHKRWIKIFWQGFEDKPKCLGLFWKGKTFSIAEFHKTALDVCGHSREGKLLL